MNKFYKPFLAWFGGMALFSHLWKFLGLGTSEVKVTFHKAKKFSSFSNRKDACFFCYENGSPPIFQLIAIFFCPLSNTIMKQYNYAFFRFFATRQYSGFLPSEDFLGPAAPTMPLLASSASSSNPDGSSSLILECLACVSSKKSDKCVVAILL